MEQHNITTATATVTVIFVATKNTPGLHNLTKSLDKLGYAYMRVGAGQKWGGWRHRMGMYIEVCKASPPESVLALIDADDVLPVRRPADMLNSFLSFSCDVVVSTECECVAQTCHHVGNYWKLHHKVHSPRIYVCAGGMIGRARALAELWQALLDSGHSDDQYALGEYVNNNPTRVVLDHTNAIFYNPPVPFRNIDPLFKFEEDGTIKNIEQGGHKCTPYFVHFQGNFLSAAISRVIFDSPTNDRLLYDNLARKLIGADALPYFSDSLNGRLIVRGIFWGIVATVLVLIVAASVAAIRRNRHTNST